MYMYIIMRHSVFECKLLQVFLFRSASINVHVFYNTSCGVYLHNYLIHGLVLLGLSAVTTRWPSGYGFAAWKQGYRVRMLFNFFFFLSRKFLAGYLQVLKQKYFRYRYQYSSHSIVLNAVIKSIL